MSALNPPFAYTGSVQPTPLSPTRIVPSTITSRPDYWKSSIPKSPRTLPWQIEVKSASDIEKMKVAGSIARAVLDAAGRLVAPGVTTDEIDALVHELTLERSAYPSPLNYHGYPKSCCTSVNEIICHGIPDSRPLASGDIVNIDITCFKDGFHGDCSEMFFVGEVDEESKRLVKATYDCWVKAMDFCKPGRKVRVARRSEGHESVSPRAPAGARRVRGR